jgi:pimeloyl-ACP methyl ester carboxylesterase
MLEGAVIHCIRAAIGALGLALPLAAASLQPQPPATPASAASQQSNFTIFIRAIPIGTEQVTVDRAGGGWRISGSGRTRPPVDSVTRRIEVRYDENWNPLELILDGSVRGEVSSIHTVVSGTTANSEVNTGGTVSERADSIDAGAVLLSNPLFAPYEALAARASGAPEGAVIPVFDTGQRALSFTVGRSTSERIQTLARIIEVRRISFSMSAPGLAPLEGEIWSDESGRLVRLSVPVQSLEVVREDVASVSARRIVISRPGDELARIPGNGFSLAGTISKPDTGAERHPAVVLVAGSGPTDRDEAIAGIPVFGHLAGALADQGFLVLRYDKRGIGQSGGRPESAAVADYGEDVRAAVRVLNERRDVDRRRIAVLAHGEGGPAAMIAAEKDDRITALVLVATIGVTGAEHNLTQVNEALRRLDRPEAEKQSTLELQKKIQNAVLTGRGWEGIPEPLRLQADTLWFQSFLAFDPARSMRNIRQPVLVVHGMLDKQVDPANAERLGVLARARTRKPPPPVDVVTIPGVNHLLVEAGTGETDEYATLGDKGVSPAVTEAIASWLQKTWSATPR